MRRPVFCLIVEGVIIACASNKVELLRIAQRLAQAGYDFLIEEVAA